MGDLLATFCGVFSADNVQKGLSLLAGREGETIASASVTLTDDPLMPMGLASCPFDREGAATHTKHILENGVLKTLLHNRKTAKKAGCKTTGNAAGAGRVAPTNLFFKPGRLTQEELLANLGDGLFLTEVTGLHAGAAKLFLIISAIAHARQHVCVDKVLLCGLLSINRTHHQQDVRIALDLQRAQASAVLNAIVEQPFRHLIGACQDLQT